MGEEFAVIGKRLARPDGAVKATGAARYVVDIKLPGMLVGKVLRSPYPHARIRRIDISRARKLAGVEAVITIDDVPPKTFNSGLAHIRLAPPLAKKVLRDQYILTDKARYVGDGIAAVAARNKLIAEEALRLIEVDFEELPAVFDPIEAMQLGAPQIHDSAPGNILQHMSYLFAAGDVAQGFHEADYIVEETFYTSKQRHSQLEVGAAIASFDGAGKLTVWSQSQSPHVTRRGLAELFDMPEGMIEVITPYIGGAFGGKSALIIEPICVVLAQKTGEPVKIEYSREEDFLVLPGREPFIQTVKMGIKKDGTITTLQTKIIANAGAYMVSASSIASFNINNFFALYRCPNTAGEIDIVYTNMLPCGPFRGFGNPEAMFALEQVVDMAAERIGMDPAGFRRRNHRRAGDPSWMASLPIASCALDECIEAGAQLIGWEGKRGLGTAKGKSHGIGMAVMSHPSDIYPVYTGHTGVFLKLNADGSANLTVSPVEMGQGSLVALAQIAAEELGIRLEDVHIVTGDTDVTLFDIGTFCSRSTYVCGNAVLRAAREAKGQLLARAARKLQVSADELAVSNGRVYVKRTPEQGLSVAEVAKDAIYNYEGEPLNISGSCSFESTAVSPSFQAGFVEVEVDTETGEVKVSRVVIAHDIGRAINPLSAEGQIEGAVAQGIGFSLLEDYVINRGTGETVTDNFTTYKIPSTLDLPDTEVIFIERPDPAGPAGAKGVGESALVTVPAAIANAIHDAIGVHMKELPMTPERIWEALKAKEIAT
ncbi:MAG: molybdopterin-dependent oxidoreductase [Chloroflexi bacterium]|nr:molybdopterin-dependent oxidoreductase [Chloroflexota bacterium]